MLLQIAPQELERYIRRISGVSEVVVVGKKVDFVGEVATAVVVQEPNSNISEKDILDYYENCKYFIRQNKRQSIFRRPKKFKALSQKQFCIIKETFFFSELARFKAASRRSHFYRQYAQERQQ